MPWRRLNPAAVADALWLDHEPGSTEDEATAAQALDHLRQQFATGSYVTDHEGRTFIGTPDEAAEHMMAA